MASGPHRTVRADFAERDPSPLLAPILGATGRKYALGPRYPGGAWGAWLVVGEDGVTAVLKCVWAIDWRPRLELATAVVDRLRERGAPVPRHLAWGYEDGIGTWYLQERVGGEPAQQLAPALLTQVQELIGLMADVSPAADASWSWSADVVRALSPGSDEMSVLDRAGPAIAALAATARDHLEAARGLPAADAVHGDLLTTQLMVDHHGELVAVIDWDEAAYGSRAIDLALLFQNVEVQGDRTSMRPDPEVIRALAERGFVIAGDGFTAAVFYHLVKMLAFVVAHNPKSVDWRLDIAKRVLANLDAITGNRI
jgi:Phosphotransferase enzyme family